MSNTSDLDPTQFVQRIRLLGEQQDQEEAERARKLEENILQGRAERERKRAERARSISPEKATTPQSFRSSINASRNTYDKQTRSPSPSMEADSLASTPREDALQRLTGSSNVDAGSQRESPPVFHKPSDEKIELPEPTKPSPNANALSRSGTLSWSRRPASSSGRRPLSIVAAENSAARSPRATPDPLPASDDQAMSRDQIAQSLSGKDPSWFRQTPDRGIGSAAYRKSQEDMPADSSRLSQDWQDAGRAQAYNSGSLGRQLPGLSRESTAEREEPSSPPPDSHSSLGSRTNSVRGSTGWSNRFSANSTQSSMSTLDGKSPLPTLDSQRFSAPSSDKNSSTDASEISGSIRGLAMSPSQGRLSPERPPSPTKGMGGFVQSAMMKRSDSVNKRWSAQQSPGLSRQSSTASNRSGYGGLAGSTAIARHETKPSGLSRDNSLEPGSRPGSSHSGVTVTQASGKMDGTDVFVKPSLRHARSKSVASPTKFSGVDGQTPPESSPPLSPSKRWSPTKSSWLESALNRPESPTKQPKPAPSQQPSWMTELAKSKQQRSSVDVSRAAAPQPVPDSPEKEDPTKPMETAKAADSGPPAPKAKPATLSPRSSRNVSETKTAPTPGPKPSDSSIDAGSPKPSPASASTAKPETPPKRDFRSTLKPRQGPADSTNKAEPEFQSVLGKLKRTQTEKYVAPDTFKNNILQGKAALNVTGGPAPRVKRDELKESLLKQKEAMKAKVAESGSVAFKKPEAPGKPVPEALARRRAMGQQGSESSFPSISKDKPATEPPEALARMQNLTGKPKPVVPEKQPSAPGMPQPGKLPGLSSKLADRFNPALAGMIARGPSPMSSGPSGSKPPGLATPDAQPSSGLGESAGETKALTHMTKGRTKGPKRRAPTSKATETTSTQEPSNEKASPSKVAAPKPTSKALETPQSIPPPVAPSKPAKMSLKEAVPIDSVPLVKPEDILPTENQDAAESEHDQTTRAAEPKPNPASPIKSPPSKAAAPSVASPKSPTKFEEPPKSVPSPSKGAIADRFSRDLRSDVASPVSVSQTETPSETPKTIFSKPKDGLTNRSSRDLKSGSSASSPQSKRASTKIVASQVAEVASRRSQLPKEEEEPQEAAPSISVKNAAGMWSRHPASDSPRSERPKSPIKLPTRKDEELAMENAGLAQRAKHGGIVLGIDTLGAPKSSPGRKGLDSPTKPLRLPVSPIPSPNEGFQISKSGPTSPQKNIPSSESFKLFGDRFDIPPDTSGELPGNVDTQSILDSYPLSMEKIKTLRMQIHEITGDGKLLSIPLEEERVLFDESMYLCTHIFGSASGAKTAEVYLWAGSAVPEATLEDAQLFARQAAKEHQGRLINIKQGKETPNFLEALGGIIITRRGSRPSSKQHMLCGRRHLGHLVFDEVDLSLKSLCSGFSYIVSSESGSIFLWKGKGCNPEEISGARLIGMDLAITGELVELEEGRENPAFLALFPPLDNGSKTVPRSAEHWRYKASSDKYRVRLFRVEQCAQQRQSQGLQVSSFWPSNILRRPSWQTFVSNVSVPFSPTLSPQASNSPVSGSPSRQPSSSLPAAERIDTRVVEIAPFSQADLEAERVYVLDAFFDIYIVVGALCRTQSHAFSTALLFAHEYGILAASTEDRPFVPVSTVVLEGVPRDMKSVFRHWRDDRVTDTNALMAGKLGRGKSLRIVGLGAALKATGAGS